MRRIVTVRPLVAVIGALMVGPGCATVATRGGGDQQVTILADPPGATVIVDGQPAGVAPATVSLARKSEHTVEVVAPGYETARLTLRRKLNPWVFGNLLVGGPIGLVLDVVTDSTHTLTPDDVSVKLKPLSGTGTTTLPVAAPAMPQPLSPAGPVPRLP